MMSVAPLVIGWETPFGAVSGQDFTLLNNAMVDDIQMLGECIRYVSRVSRSFHRTRNPVPSISPPSFPWE